jgi:hypothetical protein
MFVIDGDASFTELILFLQTVSGHYFCNYGQSNYFMTDTGENYKWNSTEPHWDDFYCNVCLPFSSAWLRLTTSKVGHVPNYVLPHGDA